MNKILFVLVFILIFFLFLFVINRYDMVVKEYEKIVFKVNVVEGVKMQGVCLVQLKELIFKKKNEFDLIFEWVNYCLVFLFEQYFLCEVFIMLEVVNDMIWDENQ